MEELGHCVAGACHGAATGQAGFKLSLLGYDPDADHRTITRELAGRRIDMASPGKSLLLQKATRSIRHKGGERIELDSGDYKTLASWIGGGAAFLLIAWAFRDRLRLFRWRR